MGRRKSQKRKGTNTIPMERVFCSMFQLLEASTVLR